MNRQAKIYCQLDELFRPKKGDPGKFVDVNIDSMDELRESLEGALKMKIFAIYTYGRGMKVQDEVVNSAQCLKLATQKSITLGGKTKRGAQFFVYMYILCVNCTYCSDAFYLAINWVPRQSGFRLGVVTKIGSDMVGW